MAKLENIEIMQALYPNGLPASWGNRISVADKGYWEASKTIIASDHFTAIRNEIFDDLINRIALTKVHQMTFDNPLSMFKRGELSYGSVIQEITTDVIQGEKFQEGNVDQFEVAPATVKAAYHQINRETVFRITEPDVRIRRAFIDNNGLQSLIQSIISQMGGSNEVDEFQFTKELIRSLYYNKELPLKQTQIIKVPKIDSNSTREKINEFILAVKSYMYKLRFPNRGFTASGIMTQINPSDMVCFLNTDVIVLNEVFNLSSAFSPEYLNLKVPIIPMDSFEDFDDKGVIVKPNNIIGVICDRETFSIYDTVRQITQADNARALYRNYFYHVHQIYMPSPYKPIAYIVAE